MAKYSEETRKLLHMAMIFGTANKCIWEFLSDNSVDDAYEKLFNLSPEEAAHLAPTVIRNLKSIRDMHIDSVLERCDKAGMEIVTCRDELYPESLSEIENPPVVLYCQGIKELLLSPNLLTIVGTRNPTDYTLYAEKQLCRELIEAGIVPVTGFAVGVDIMANRVALEMGCPSIAVMGCGLDINYPKQNKIFRKDIIKTGLLLSEYPPATTPRSHNFPQRNRILAGISSGTFVVQAPEKSGALITAEYAAMWGRDVYCLPPANIFDIRYEGVKKFLRDGATAVFDTQDILINYDIQLKPNLQTPTRVQSVHHEKNCPEPQNAQGDNITDADSFGKDHVSARQAGTIRDDTTVVLDTQEDYNTQSKSTNKTPTHVQSVRHEKNCPESQNAQGDNITDADSFEKDHVSDRQVDTTVQSASPKELSRKESNTLATFWDGTPMSDNEIMIFSIIAENENVHIDVIIQKSGLDVKTVSGILINLEMFGKIERRAGNRFRIIP